MISDCFAVMVAIDLRALQLELAVVDRVAAGEPPGDRAALANPAALRGDTETVTFIPGRAPRPRSRRARRPRAAAAHSPARPPNGTSASSSSARSARAPCACGIFRMPHYCDARG